MRWTLRTVGVTLATLAACSGEETTAPPGSGVASVVVVPVDDPVFVGDFIQLTAVARTSAGDTLRHVTFTWQSLDPLVATVSAAGIVTGLAEGTARIRASSGSRSGEAAIRVEPLNPPPVVTSLTPASVMAGGPELTLTIRGTGFRPNIRLRWNGVVRPTTYLSETEAQATIWAGDIAEVGEALIEVINTSPGGGAAPVIRFSILEQTDPVASITLRQEVAYTTVGGAVPAQATVWNAAGQVLTGRLVTWRSSNQLVATVNGNGIIQPVGIGEATITAESEGISATLALTVGTTISHLLLDNGSALAVYDMRLGGDPSPFWEPAVGTRLMRPRASPDGRWIAYTIMAGATPSVALLDQANHTYTFLPSEGASDQPAWSPTGDRIALRIRREGRTDLWVMKPDGTGAVNLTTTMPAGFEAGWPAWSPDGTRIAFSAGPAGLVSLYVMRTDGTEIRPILISAEHDSEADWRFDAVVFTRRRQDGSSDLYRIPVAGGTLIRLTQSGRANSPAWSPDGRWIAFADGPAVNGRHDIKVVRPFGDETRILSSAVGDGGGANPSWLTHQ